MSTVKRPRVLCLDDEPSVLQGLKLQLRKGYRVATSTSGSDALEQLREAGPFQVVISDMRMPRMDGATFLAKVREEFPETVRILLTGQTDLTSAVAAVNEGQIFRFLTKPCGKQELRATLESAVEHYQLITAERELLQNTLTGSIQALVELVGLTRPAAVGRANRLREHAAELARRMGFPHPWQVELAALLSQIGSVTLTEETAEKVYFGQRLDEDEREQLSQLPQIAGRVIAGIPRMGPVQAILDALATGEAADGQAERGGAILRVANDYDTWVTRGLDEDQAEARLGADPNKYDPEIVKEFLDSMRGVARAAPRIIESVNLKELREGMVFAEDVKSRTGTLLIARGYEVSVDLLSRVRRFREGWVIEPLQVYLPEPSAGPTEIEDEEAVESSTCVEA